MTEIRKWEKGHTEEVEGMREICDRCGSRVPEFGSPLGLYDHLDGILAIDRAVDDVTQVSSLLLSSLVTSAAPKDREAEAARAHARAIRRFGA